MTPIDHLAKFYEAIDVAQKAVDALAAERDALAEKVEALQEERDELKRELAEADDESELERVLLDVRDWFDRPLHLGLPMTDPRVMLRKIEDALRP
jgi:histidinol-phosphate/aromatic aminotransferase/cobyric acid decarboxylase-like protein